MTTGVYLITNRATGERYVGSSIHVERRWREHLNDLQRGIHRNDRLQDHYLMFGPSSFTYRIIAKCEREDLCTLEHALIAYLKPEYNNSYKGIGG